MAIVVGIDEAGYGPVLGPLVVTAAAFRVSDPGADLWQRLAPTVHRVGRAYGRDGLVVDDSKRVYTPSRGLQALERSVLAFSVGRTPLPCPLGAWLSGMGYTGLAQLGSQSWYANPDLDLPTVADGDDVATAARTLADGLGAAGVEWIGAQVEPCFPPELNDLFDAYDNKATALFVLTGRLLHWTWQWAGEEPVHVVLDRQGGREHYAPLLRQTFPEAEVMPVAEGRATSAYRISDGRRVLEASFQEQADGRHLPVALASMFSKYVRELFMRLFNRFWTSQVPGLRPTAGYYVDAQRFLAATYERRRQLNIPDRLFIRSR